MICKSSKVTPPYASALFGVYQTLLGWKSKQLTSRVDRERRVLVESLFDSIVNDSTFISKGRLDPNGPVIPRLPGWMRSNIGQDVEAVVSQYVENEKRLPNNEEWSKVLADADLNGKLGSLISTYSVSAGSSNFSFSPLRESIVVDVYWTI